MIRGLPSSLIKTVTPPAGPRSTNAASASREKFAPTLETIPEQPKLEAEAHQHEGHPSTADASSHDARRSTEQLFASQADTNPAFAQFLGYQDRQPVAETPVDPTTRQPEGFAQADQPSRTDQTDTPGRAHMKDPPALAEAKNDLVAQRAKLRRLLQDHTNMTPKQIDKTLRSIDKDVNSIQKAIENKYGGASNVPPEVLREIMDLVKSYIETLVKCADWSSVLRASAAR